MYEIKIIPQPSPRPRVRQVRTKAGKNFVQTYYPNGYHEYKDMLVKAIQELQIPPRDYLQIIAEFGAPYPKATAKKNLIEGHPCRKKFDTDNLIKPLMDALEQAEIIENDRQIYETRVRKVWTTKGGYIRFYLGQTPS